MLKWLAQNESSYLEGMLNPPLVVPSGDVRENIFFSNRKFSRELRQVLIEKMRSCDSFHEAEPILLGSAAREELCPYSDIDILCAGSEEVVQKFVNELSHLGIKVRIKIPTNKDDWSVGSQVFDSLALLQALPLTPEAAGKVFYQQRRIFSQIKKWKKKWIKELSDEKEQRHLRYAHIANFLEPNLKFGPGGLRDIEQAEQILTCFSADFSNIDHALRVLRYYKDFFLCIRQRLHLAGLKDVLVAQQQSEIAIWFGYSDSKAFMREVQRGLSRVHFYVQWVFEWIRTATKKREEYNQVKISSTRAMFKFLEKDQGIIAQKCIRSYLDRVFESQNGKSAQFHKFQFLSTVVDPHSPENLLSATFQSRLIDKLLPEIKPLVGYVQHDQYHRYTADMHIQQVCLELKRLVDQKKTYGYFYQLAKDFQTWEWEVLKWTCLLHDLGKGRNQDHSDWGAEFASHFLKQNRVPVQIQQEVSWMVKHHLLLSQLAFRRNFLNGTVLLEMMSFDMTPERARRLGVFTALDIRGSNPEAWNEWKAKLLESLVRSFSAPQSQAKMDLSRYLKGSLLQSQVLAMDDFTVQSIGVKIVAQDILSLLKNSDLKEQIRIIKTSSSQNFWIRIYQQKDRPGLLSDYLSFFMSLGLNIRHAGVHSWDSFGVYDWFFVRGSKSPTIIKKSLQDAIQKSSFPQAKKMNVEFQSIQVIPSEGQSFDILFRALDQRGLLYSAVSVLSEVGLNVTRARVHTWGREVEDVITVNLANSNQTYEEVFEELSKRLNLPLLK